MVAVLIMETREELLLSMKVYTIGRNALTLGKYINYSKSIMYYLKVKIIAFMEIFALEQLVLYRIQDHLEN